MHLGRSLFAWGLIDQALSSATTFLLTLIAARSLGPAGLGTIALGYASFLVVLGIHRTLLVDPLLTRVATTTRSTGEAFRAATSTTATVGALASLVALAVGLVGTGAVARGMFVFSPWFVPALLQVLLRSWLYREGRGAVATLSSGAWLLTMAAAVAVGLRSTDWQISAAWGLGACVAVAVASAGTGIGLASPRAAGAWFNYEAFRVSGWRTTSSIVFSAATYARVSGMSAILGPAAIGGYRSVESIFAPTSLFGPALANPGTPMMQVAVERGGAPAWTLALKISALSTGLVLAYIVPITLARDLVLRLFGTSFSEYESLILPIAVGALIGGMGTGFTILLVAARRMNELGLVVLVNSALTLALTLPLAALFGLEAAAWGIVLGALPPLLIIAVIARRTTRELEAVRRDEGSVETRVPPASAQDHSS